MAGGQAEDRCLTCVKIVVKYDKLGLALADRLEEQIYKHEGTWHRAAGQIYTTGHLTFTFRVCLGHVYGGME